MMFRCGLALVLCLLSVAAAAPTARAFCRAVVSEEISPDCIEDPDAIPLFWDRSCVTYHFTEGFFDKFTLLDEPDIREIFQRATDTWTDVRCSDGELLGFYFEQADSIQMDDFDPDVPLGANNDSLIMSRSAQQWADSGNSSAAFAFSYVWFLVDTGEIIDVDMEINMGRGPYGVCNRPCLSGTTDLLNTVTHEMGHYLGLAHSDVTDSTMFKSAMTGENLKRSLHPDDIEGICTAYPSPDVLAENPCLGQEPGCMCPPPAPLTETETGCGCRTVQPASAPNAAALALGAVLGVLVWRRRR